MITTSPERRTLWVFGAGGHGREVAWLAREAHPGIEIAFVVDDPRYLNGPVDGVPVQLVSAVTPPPSTCFVTAVGDPTTRRRGAAALTSMGLEAIALVHPSAIVAPSATVGAGAIVAAGSIVSEGVRIGAHAIVNIGCTLSHDVVIDTFATVSPGTHIAGHVSVEEGAFLGVGVNVINGTAQHPIVIGRDAVVGAGAVVTGDVDAGATVAGVPARALRSGDAE